MIFEIRASINNTNPISKLRYRSNTQETATHLCHHLPLARKTLGREAARFQAVVDFQYETGDFPPVLELVDVRGYPTLFLPLWLKS